MTRSLADHELSRGGRSFSEAASSALLRQPVTGIHLLHHRSILSEKGAVSPPIGRIQPIVSDGNLDSAIFRLRDLGFGLSGMVFRVHVMFLEQVMNQPIVESAVESADSETQMEALGQLSELLEKFAEPMQDFSGMRDEARLPVCVKLQVTPCNSAYVPVGPEELAFAQNLSGGGAALIFASAPVSDFMLIRIGGDTMVLRLLWKRQAGKFVEAGGEFVSRF